MQQHNSDNHISLPHTLTAGTAVRSVILAGLQWVRSIKHRMQQQKVRLSFACKGAT
jgi:hypothetical protein